MQIFFTYSKSKCIPNPILSWLVIFYLVVVEGEYKVLKTFLHVDITHYKDQPSLVMCAHTKSNVLFKMAYKFIEGTFVIQSMNFDHL